MWSSVVCQQRRLAQPISFRHGESDEDAITVLPCCSRQRCRKREERKFQCEMLATVKADGSHSPPAWRGCAVSYGVVPFGTPPSQIFRAGQGKEQSEWLVVQLSLKVAALHRRFNRGSLESRCVFCFVTSRYNSFFKQCSKAHGNLYQEKCESFGVAYVYLGPDFTPQRSLASASTPSWS